jgi:magnesium transporter
VVELLPELLRSIMILAYIIENGMIIKKEIFPGDSRLPANMVWIDMSEPSVDEKKYIEKCFNIDVLTSEEISRIEVMSPFFKSKEAYYMTLTTISRNDSGHFDGTPFTSVMINNCLITLHYSKMSIIETFINLTKYDTEIYRTPSVLLSALTEVFIHDVGEILEKTGNEADTLIQNVFDKGSRAKDSSPTNNYNDVIAKVGQAGNTISRCRESLVSINRLIIYFTQIEKEKPAYKEHNLRLKHISREISSLTEYANFLSQRISFLLDATLGLLSVEQNMIVKVFTIASAVLMPPTLIASVYGMNFQNMPPEVSWRYGYYLALFLMFISAAIPFRYFKKKGWL